MPSIVRALDIELDEYGLPDDLDHEDLESIYGMRQVTGDEDDEIIANDWIDAYVASSKPINRDVHHAAPKHETLKAEGVTTDAKKSNKSNDQKGRYWGSAVDAWIHELKNSSIRISSSEQHALHEQAMNGDMEAANKLTRSFYRMIAKEIRRRGKEMFGYEDAIEIAFNGVAKAIETYDKNRTGKDGQSAKLSTHVGNHIWWAFLDEYRRRKRILHHENVSIDYTDYDGNRIVEVEDDSISPYAALIAKEHKERMIALTEYLDDQDTEIAELRFGLRDDIVRTLDEVSKEVNLTRERVRQRLVKILDTVSMILKQDGKMPMETALRKMNKTSSLRNQGGLIRMVTGLNKDGKPHTKPEIAQIRGIDETTVFDHTLAAHERLLHMTGAMKSDHPIAVLEQNLGQAEVNKHKEMPYIDGSIDPINGEEVQALLERMTENGAGDMVCIKSLALRMGSDRNFLPRTAYEIGDVTGHKRFLVMQHLRKARIEAFYFSQQESPRVPQHEKLYLGLMRYAMTHDASQSKVLAARAISDENLSKLETAFGDLDTVDQEILMLSLGVGTGVCREPDELAEEFGVLPQSIRHKRTMALKRLNEIMNINPYCDERTRTAYEAHLEKVTASNIPEISDEMKFKDEMIRIHALMKSRGHGVEADIIGMRLGLEDDTVASYRSIGPIIGKTKKYVEAALEAAFFTMDGVLRKERKAQSHVGGIPQ